MTRELEVIRSVAADLTEPQLQALRRSGSVRRFYPDLPTVITGKPSDKRSPGGGTAGETDYPAMIGADQLHLEGVTGRGVTIAMLDSGLWPDSDVLLDTSGRIRFLGSYDVLTGRFNTAQDGNGHGTHVTGVAISRRSGQAGYDGVAPEAAVVMARAFDVDGQARYSDVIAGLDWVLANRQAFGIRVLNLSFSAPPQSYYWDDPLNQAVMAAWSAGIVVVASAGNTDPGAMTIGAPGNVPYVITVGAMTDSFTPDDTTDDHLATFSSAGPTVEGFVKPELVAPGGLQRLSAGRRAGERRRRCAVDGNRSGQSGS